MCEREKERSEMRGRFRMRRGDKVERAQQRWWRGTSKPGVGVWAVYFGCLVLCVGAVESGGTTASECWCKPGREGGTAVVAGGGAVRPFALRRRMLHSPRRDG